ncbi:hypothetical protein HKD37_05G012968 [Glycine soja]
MLLPDVQTFHYDGLLLICYVPNGTIMITHPLDITVIFDEMMRTLGYTPYMIPRRTSDIRDYRGLFHGRKRGRGNFGGLVGIRGPSIPLCCP